MARRHCHQATPQLRDTDRDMPPRPWIDQFTSGYMQRMMHRFPMQGDREPWINPQDYGRDKKMIRFAPLDDGALVFSRRLAAASIESDELHSLIGSAQS